MARNFNTAGLLILCFSILIHYGFADFDSKTSKSNIDKTKMFGAKLNKTQRDVEHMAALMDAPLQDLLWCGNSDQSILALTDKGSVYTTTDFGKTWTNLRSSVGKINEGEAGSIENMGEVSSMLQSPVDPSIFIFSGTDGLNWITEDCGLTVRAIKSVKNLKEFLFHPYEPKWILASRLTTCEDFIIESCKIYKELYITQDLGESWTVLADYVIQFAWGTPEKFFFERYIPLQRIVVAHHLEKSGDQQFRGLSVKTEIAYSDNLFKMKKTILKQGNQFLITKNHFFAIHMDEKDSQKIKLYAGASDVQTYKLQPVILPIEAQQSINEGNLLEKAYTVLDATDDQVYLQINHENERSGDIYISSLVHLYSLSLQNSARSPSGQSDFHKVEGLEGIVLANIYDTAEADISPALAGINNNRGSRLQELDEYKMTRISFNKGSFWQPLIAPSYNAKGGLIKCETKESCHLHLHSFSSTKYAPLDSTDNALGILLGVGNVGKYLSNREKEANTYLSRDAGRTWFEILQGSHIFEIGDHGAIIVAAPDQVATTHILYTWDQGLSWEVLEVSDTPIFMSKILVEPSNTGLHFVVYGRTAALSQEAKGVIISINFGSLNQRICMLPGRPDAAASDYENWTPHGIASCFMGQQTTYIRRRRDSQCVNPEGLEQVYSYKICECVEADWQCDFGYEQTKNGICEKKVGSFPPIEISEECDSGYYFATQGYRKISGNRCLGGVNHEPIRVRCPESTFPVIRILVLLWVVALITGILVLLRKSKPVQLSNLIRTIFIRLVTVLFSARIPLVITYEMDQSPFGPSRNDESINNNEISVQTRIQDLSIEPIPNEDQCEIMAAIKEKEKEAEKAEIPEPTDNSIVSIN